MFLAHKMCIDCKQLCVNRLNYNNAQLQPKDSAQNLGSPQGAENIHIDI